MFKEFKKFISRGNVVDLAVGIIVGGAFSKIILSLVNDIINPIIGIILSGKSISDLKYVLAEAVEKNPEVAIKYGMFIQAIINFLIISFVIFIAIKSYNKLKKKEEVVEEVKEPKLTLDQELLIQIRDHLKSSK